MGRIGKAVLIKVSRVKSERKQKKHYSCTILSTALIDILTAFKFLVIISHLFSVSKFTSCFNFMQ